MYCKAEMSDESTPAAKETNVIRLFVALFVHIVYGEDSSVLQIRRALCQHAFRCSFDVRYETASIMGLVYDDQSPLVHRVEGYFEHLREFAQVRIIVRQRTTRKACEASLGCIAHDLAFREFDVGAIKLDTRIENGGGDKLIHSRSIEREIFCILVVVIRLEC